MMGRSRKGMMLIILGFMVRTWSIAGVAIRGRNGEEKVAYPNLRWKWNDPEHNRRRTKALLEWGNDGGRPNDVNDDDDSFLQVEGEQSVRQVRVVSRRSDRLTTRRSPYHHMSSLQKRLSHWRQRLEEKVDAEAKAERRASARRRAIVSLQVGIAQSHDRNAPDVNLENVAKRSGVHGVELLESVKKVAHKIRGVSKSYLERRADNAQALLETESSRESVDPQTSAKLANAAIGAAGGPFDPSASYNNDNTKCVMCLYIMEMTERDVGFPQRDFYSDVYPSYSSRNQGSPGPASYFRNFGGAVSQPPGSYNPIPGPGYSFLEQAESARAPISAWTNYGDYSTISSPDQNLHTRYLEELAVDAKRDMRKHVKDTDMYSMYNKAFETQYGVEDVERKSDTRGNLRKKIDEVTSLNGGMRSWIETGEGDDGVPTAFVETEFIGSAAAAMGLTVCRPGKKYCRPRLKQPGRRQLERRVMMQAVQSEYATMSGLMQKSITDTCMDMPESFAFNCEPMISKLSEISEKYIHDYDDDEICTDLKFCSVKQLKVPREPYVLKIPLP